MKIFQGIILLGMVGCASDNTTKIVNNQPEATITSHVDGEELLEGYSIFLRGTVSDNNNSFDELTASWSSGATPLCEPTTPESDGTVQCEFVVFDGMTDISLQVLDPNNAVGIDNITVSVTPTDAPLISILSPNSTDSYYNNLLILFSAVISDTEDGTEDLITVWNSNLDGDLAINAVPDSQGQIDQFLNLSEGQHAITVSVEDTSGKMASETVAITVNGPNTDPRCEITAPDNNTAVVFGQNITFSGTTIDDDINNSLLAISWESNQDGVFDATAANTAGEMTVVFDGLSVGNHIVTLRGEDEVGGFCTDTVSVTVGTPPSLSISAPLPNSIFSLNEPISFIGTVSDMDDIPSDISLSWYSDIDGEFSTQGSDSNGNISFTSSSMSAGHHNLYITATDTAGLTSSSSLAIQVNTPPTAPSVSIQPNPALTSDGLSFSLIDSIDADGDFLVYTYEWFQNGLLTTYTSLTVPSSATSHLDEWTIRVTPNDGYVDGDFAEDSIVISNSLPTVDAIAISPTTAYNDSVLLCTATASDDDQILSLSYEWTVGNSTYSGASLDLSTTSAQPNNTVTCVASVEDDAGVIDSLSTDLTLDNRAPTVDSVSISPTPVYTNTEVSCSSTIQDDDNETPTEVVDWRVGGISIGISTTLQLSNTLVSVGETLECTITATDGYQGSSSDSTSVTISNTDPQIDAMSLTPLNPNQHDLLACTASATDTDGSVPTLSFIWTNLTSGDVYLSTSSTADSASLDLSNLPSLISVDDVIACSATAMDLHGGMVTQSESVVVINSAPQFDVGAAISPSSTIYFGTDLTCSALASDPDDGSINPTFEWSVGGGYITAGPTYTVSSSDISIGETLLCTATATDSDGETTISTDSVVISNAPPTVDSVVLSPDPAYTTNDIVATAIASDLNGDSLTLAYAWTVNGNPVQTGPDNTLVSTNFVKGDAIDVFVVADDGTDLSQSLTANISISNSPPSAPQITLSPSAPIEQMNELFCYISNPSSDPDGDSVDYTFTWEVNGQPFIGANVTASDSTVPASETISGDFWTCTVTPDDNIINGQMVSASVNIQSSSGSEEFFYTGSTQSFTIPGGVYLISIEAYGAEGGTGSEGTGGLGGLASAWDIAVVPGEQFDITVGSKGLSGNGAGGGFNGGGVGAFGSATAYGGGGGGGASDVRPVGGGNSSRLIVAGGGGGGGADGCTASALKGGHGGDTTAGSGEPGNLCSCDPSGSGGTPSSGGVVGSWACGSNCNAQAGSFGVGGNGNTSGSCGGTTGGGGGGGGWYGGGGGGLGAGGGGSSYISWPTNSAHSSGVNSGDGYILISW